MTQEPTIKDVLKERIIVLEQTIDAEVASLRSRCQRMESFMMTVAKRLDLQFEPT